MNDPSSVASCSGAAFGSALSLRSASRIRSNAGPSSRRPPTLRLYAPASVSEAPANEGRHALAHGEAAPAPPAAVRGFAGGIASGGRGT